MKKLTYLLILCLPIIFQSCEELIDIDLNESDPKYVIEAELSDIFQKVCCTITYLYCLAHYQFGF